jgi:hypothetical protein
VHWNYRTVYHPPSKYKVGDKEFDREEYLAIHEVHYDNDGNPNTMTLDEIVTGDEGEDSLISLKWMLENQLKALKKPIINCEIENNIFKEINKEKQNDFSKSVEEEE